MRAVVWGSTEVKSSSAALRKRCHRRLG